MGSSVDRHIVGIDLLRFAAAFMVMVFHLAFWAWAFPEGQVGRASQGQAEFEAWAAHTYMGWVGVQVFFVISGFVIAFSAATARPFAFFTSRVVRLGPGVWVCATLTLLASAWVQLDTHADLALAYLRSMVFYPWGPWIDSVYWTLGVEIAFYALVFALVCLRRFAWLLPLVCIIGAGSTLYWVAYTAAGLHAAVPGEALLFNVQNSRWSQLLLVQHGCFFALGVLLWWRWQRERAPVQWFWIGLFLVGGCLQIAGEANLKLHKTGLAFSPLVPCLLWLASVALIQASLHWNRPMHALPPALVRASRRLGLMTYPLYLLHNVLGAIVFAMAAGLGASPSGALVTAMLASIALSWWVSVRLEPPLQRWTRERLLRARDVIEQRLRLRRARSA